MKLVPGLQEIINNLKHEEDVLGCVLSGAGPAILVITKNNNQDKIKEIIQTTWNNLNVKSEIFIMNPIDLLSHLKAKCMAK